MKRKVSRLRLSPNEEARIIREELERRRKLRIQQVREQQRGIALQIRREVEQRRQHELQQLEEQLREDWERQQRDRLLTLQRLYQESLQLLGQSHRSARDNEPDVAAAAQREEENHAKAEERHREALKELKAQRIREEERRKQSINARKSALQTEKERSAKVAGLPPPRPDPIQGIDLEKTHALKRPSLNVFAATRYHLPESAVEKEPETEQPDAREEADLEARRLEELQGEERRRREEQLEKARLRGRQALRREQLIQDRQRLVVELEHMQQTDLLRRRQQVSHMPPQIFQPLYRRQETREDFQREMEFAFEDMYTGERRVKGDLVVQLVPEPLPASSTSDQDLQLDQELDVTLEENAKAEAEHVQTDCEEGRSSEQEPSPVLFPAGGAMKPPPRRALTKLLDRIRSQRSDWINGASCVPAAASPTVFTDLIPERDTTIESGSLSHEADKRTPTPPPGISPRSTFLRCLCPTDPAVEPAEPPPAAETSPPGVFISRTQQTEEERRRKEAELEAQKLQQEVLLQELQEQKAQLERLLLEARQERERLKAAVTQEALVQPQVPVQNQAQTGSPSEVGPAACPAGEDGSTRRVREHQRRLLEQNRIHQRSVEVARQRLEEYQRALRLRHNMAAAALRPPAHPAGPVPPSGTGSGRPSAPLQVPASSGARLEPRTSVDVASRGSSASPPASSGAVGSSVPSDGSVPNPFGAQRPGVTAQLTDDILERVTQHLPQRLRPPPRLPASEPGRAAGPSEPDRRPLDPGPWAESLISREEDLDWRRRGLLEEERRLRSQREALQVLMDTDEESGSDAPSDGSDSDGVRQRRLKLLASLLRAMEESNGGTLSHLEEGDEGPQPTPSDRGGKARLVPSADPPEPLEPPGLLPAPRTQRPPVTRVRLGFNEAMPEQHELSAIQEVETPVNTSRVTGPEDAADFIIQDGSDRTLQSPCASSSGPDSETSGRLPWRERLLSGAGSSPECCGAATRDGEPLPTHRFSPALLGSDTKATAPPGSDSGRGADSSRSKSPSEPLRRTAGSDCLSSTTISSGSYVSTDPEQHGSTGEPRPFNRSGSGLGGAASPCAPTPGLEGNWTSGSAGPSADSPFSDSSIQRIIDKYTRELDLSLGAAGTAAGSEGPSLEGSGSDSLRPSVASRTEDENPPGHQDTPSPGRPAWARFCPGDPSLSVEPDQDSFRPLRLQLADQSSCLAPEESHLVLEQLLGQPSAHSSMIGPGSGPPAHLGSDLGGWDSALSRLIGRLSQQSGSHWPGRVTSEPSWLEETRMRPLVGELDGSVDRPGGSPGAPETRDPAVPAPLPEASDHGPVGAQSPVLQNQPGPVELDSLGAEDSFHPLLPEHTQNQTADPTMTFHLPDLSMSDSADGSPAGPEPGPSPEQLRTEEPNCCRVLQESFSQLAFSEESVLPSPALDSCDPSDFRCREAPEPRTSAGPGPVSERHAETSPDRENQPDSSGTAWDVLQQDVLQQDVLQQRRQALIQRSNRRLEELKARSRVRAAGRDPVRAARGPEQRHLSAAATGSGPGTAEVRIVAPEQRNQNLSEMHKRTRRLYEQLEEVKQRRAVRSRQEDWAKNRLKAKEFHRKTLQKLRAKQTRQ
ncbi:uncharacterized protein cep295 [Fundulus diaphanus]